MEKIIHLASGIRIGVDVGGVVHGFCAGDIITADERHCKWNGKEVVVEKEEEEEPWLRHI